MIVSTPNEHVASTTARMTDRRARKPEADTVSVVQLIVIILLIGSIVS